MHHVGASPWTIYNVLIFVSSDGCSACSLLVFCVFCPSGRRRFVYLNMVIFFSSCLANHSAVTKPHPTEGAAVYAGCGIPGCCEVCCAVYTPLCGGRCAAYLRCSLFFGCREFAFSNVHDICSLVNQTRTSISIHPMYRI